MTDDDATSVLATRNRHGRNARDALDELGCDNVIEVVYDTLIVEVDGTTYFHPSDSPGQEWLPYTLANRVAEEHGVGLTYRVHGDGVTVHLVEDGRVDSDPPRVGQHRHDRGGCDRRGAGGYRPHPRRSLRSRPRIPAHGR